MRGIHRSPLNSPYKGQWRGALMFSLICAWINSWVNNREAGDLRRRRTHYDVIVMHFVNVSFGVLKCTPLPPHSPSTSESSMAFDEQQRFLLIFRHEAMTFIQKFVQQTQNSRVWIRSVCTFLTHWGRVTHICIVKLTVIGSDNGLSPGRRQAIIWTNAGILLIGP